MRSTLVGVVICGGLMLQPAARAVQPLNATNTRSFTDTRLALTAAAADVVLPAGDWRIASITPGGVLEQAFLLPQRVAGSMEPGRRVSASQIQRVIDSGRWRVQQFYSPVVDFAQTRAGIGPRDFKELDPTKWGWALQQLFESGYPEDRGNRSPVPLYFLVPSVPLPPAGARAPGGARNPLVVELRPYINDGRHWVLFTNGDVERVAVDKALLATHRQTLRPVRNDASIAAATSEIQIQHALFGLQRNPAAAAVTVTLVDAGTTRKIDVQWPLSGSRADPQALAGWARARDLQWLTLVDYGEAPILRSWLARTASLYGGQAPTSRTRAEMMMGMGPDGMPRSADTFSVLGGRAALRETLQTELIRPRPTRPDGPGIPVTNLTGIEVVSLPFERMLAGRPGGRLPLVDRVPADRLLIYFAKPAALFPFLDKGGDFLARAGSFYTASAFDDDLKAKYLRRLGLGERAGRAFIESGGVTELALVASDLFFIDGTDVTILMRVRSPDFVATAMRLLGLAEIAPDVVTEKPTPGGQSAFWARQGDLLMVGTSRRDVEQMLRLGAGGESLGRSAEFRYMLTELPPRTETRAFVYLSDPFIRRMVGPAVKIGQLRRMRARADMTMITAGALLARLDGRKEGMTLLRLMDLGYVPRSIPAASYALRDDLSVVSQTWGTLADMKAIDTVAIDRVSESEAEAYQVYMNEYRQYWRQFFDPIAMRLDDAPNGELELSTFILPLVDSDLYNGVRGFLQSLERGAKLRVPALSPEPVAQVSLNLTEEAWVSLSGGFSSMFTEYTGISAEIVDLFGPGMHVAIQDDDPIISIGTGDLLGAFGSPTFGRGFDMMIPVAVSVLTRPCKILIELQDSKRALELLRAATTRGAGRGDRWNPAAMEFRQIEGRDAWVYTFGVPGMVTLRLGIEIQNGYLILSNTPWSKPVTVQSADARPLNGAAIRVAPDAVREGLAGLFATQAEQDQRAALASMAALLPLLQTVSTSPDQASSLHATLFGSKPLHPRTGSWVWTNGRLESSVYGSSTQWKTPVFKPELGNFGLFDGATLVDLNMQFEAGGLRAMARWKWKD